MKKILILLLVSSLACLSLQAQELAIRFVEYEDLDKALTVAKELDKLVFIDFYTDWCAPCKTMDKEVFSDGDVGAYFNEVFLSFKVDAEKGSGVDLARGFKVGAYPTFVFLENSGEEAFRLVGARAKDVFLETIQRNLDENRSPQRLEERYQSGERSAQLINDYVFSLMSDGKEKQGYKIIEESFQNLPAAEKSSPVNFYLYERYSRGLKDPKIIYLMDNMSSFRRDVGDKKVDGLVYRYLRGEFILYANGYKKETDAIDEAEFEELLRINELVALPDEYGMNPLIELAKIRNVSDDLIFIAACEEKFSELTESDQFFLMLTFPKLKGEDQVRSTALKIIQEYGKELPEDRQKILKRVEEGMKSS